MIDQLPAVLDHHAIGGEIVANRQILSIAQDRTGAGDQNAITTDGGKDAVTDDTEAAVDYLAAVANHQAVTRATVARIQETIAPDRTVVGHEGKVIAVPVARTQFAPAIDLYPTPLNE